MLHDRQRVESLLAVADGQRHVGGGQSYGGELGAGHRARAAQREVRGGIRQVHPVHVRQGHVRDRVGRGARQHGACRPGTRGKRAVGRLALAEVLRAGDVQDLHPGAPDRASGARQCPVERLSALRAAEDEQHRQVGPEPEVRPCLVAEREPVEVGDLPPDRQPQVPGVAQLGLRLPGEDVGGQVRAEPVGDAGERVGLVHHDGDIVPLGRQVGGRGHVAAEPDEHVGPHPVEDLPRGVHRAGQPPGDGQQLGRHRAGQRHGGDEFKVIAAQRHQAGLKAPLSAETGHLDAAVRLPQRVGERKSRLDMTG